MTGSGTALDPYVIWDIADLQSLRTRDAAYYKLGSDIDASATPGWFGGMGFEPVDWPFPQRRFPTGDFSSAGPWTVFPAAPPTMFDKVNELDPDLDVSYIRFGAGGATATILFTSPNFNIPAGSTINRLQMSIVFRDEGGPGSNDWRGYVRVGGINYQSPNKTSGGGGAIYHISEAPREFMNNPATGLPWTAEDINGVGPNPLEAWGFKVTGTRVFRFTQIFARVDVVDCPVIHTFNGNGHKITDLFIDRRTDTLYIHAGHDIGLFHQTVSSQVRNLTLENLTVKGAGDVGGLVGTGYGANLKLENIQISGSILGTQSTVGGIIGQTYVVAAEINNCSFNGQVEGDYAVAGIVGLAWNYGAVHSKIQNSNFNGLVTVDTPFFGNAGGIAGYAYKSDILSCTVAGTINGGTASGGVLGLSNMSNIQDSSSSATLLCGNEDYVGGIVGTTIASAPLAESILRCKSTGNINANGLAIGGLVGYADVFDIGQSFVTGNVVGDTRVGGLIGFSNARVRNCYAVANVTGPAGGVGGLIGVHDSTFNIENSYSAGLVQGGLPIGGLIGEDWLSGGLIVNCFWDIETSGQTTSDGGTGKTTTEMKEMATFADAGWDIEGNESADLANGYPFLSWQLPGSSPIWYIYIPGIPPPPALTVVTLPATEIR
jgi:hypothetical protein